MADMTLSAQFLMRNDTAANWITINPVLGKGEMGVETNTHKFKFGDGTSPWNDLPYASAQGALEKNVDPVPDDKGYDIGTRWINTSTKTSFIFMGTDEGKGIWRKTVTLNSDGKIDSSILPPLAISQPFPAADEAAMLALDAQTGDVAIRADSSKCFILMEAPASNLSNWLELLAPEYTDELATANFNTNVSKTSIRNFKDGADVVMKSDIIVLDGGNASGSIKA